MNGENVAELIDGAGRFKKTDNCISTCIGSRNPLSLAPVVLILESDTDVH